MWFKGMRFETELSREKVVRVRSWDELPEVLEPGVYEIDGARITLREPLPREVVQRSYKLARRLAKKYGSSA